MKFQHNMVSETFLNSSLDSEDDGEKLKYITW